MRDHLWTALIVVGVGVWKFWKPIKATIGGYLGMQKTIHETEQRVSDGYKRELGLEKLETIRLRAMNREVLKQLARCVRDKDLRDDINRQDRATIRKLKRRLTAHKVEFADIESEIEANALELFDNHELAIDETED